LAHPSFCCTLNASRLRPFPCASRSRVRARACLLVRGCLCLCERATLETLLRRPLSAWRRGGTKGSCCQWRVIGAWTHAACLLPPCPVLWLLNVHHL
jgi:hypothetical protein